MNRLGEIELMRFLTAMIVLLYHGQYYAGCAHFLPGGNIGVEFFFLLSGYLMAAHLQRKVRPISSTVELNKETYHYLWRRLCSFWPELFIACIIGLFVNFWGNHFNVNNVLSIAYKTLMGDILLMQMTGLSGYGANAVAWYLSALLLSSAILYPLLRRYGHSPILPIIALFMLGYILNDDKQPYYAIGFASVRKWLGWTHIGNLRALSELILGASLYPLVQNLAHLQATKGIRILLTFYKWSCYIVVLIYCLHPCGSAAPITLAALISSIGLSFSRLCYDNDWHQQAWIIWLGRFSLPLYLSHIFWAQNLAAILTWPEAPWEKLIVYVILSSLTAMAVMTLAKQFRRFFTCLCNKQKI